MSTEIIGYILILIGGTVVLAALSLAAAFALAGVYALL